MKRSQSEQRPAWSQLLASELNAANYPEFRERIRIVESGVVEHTVRQYPGYPRVALPKPKGRRWTRLETTLAARRSVRQLAASQPTARDLSRVLWFSHGAHESDGRGPTPSSGRLCALELYVATIGEGWLEAGAYHYDRVGHWLSRVSDSQDRSNWAEVVPSLNQLEGGSLLWILVSDVARMEAKYQQRAARLALLEAGHLMQNLCLVSQSVGRCTVPLGGFFENDLARQLLLPGGDCVLYAGVFG
jgi:SagB-type dehydrogenase family enzyme